MHRMYVGVSISQRTFLMFVVVALFGGIIGDRMVVVVVAVVVCDNVNLFEKNGKRMNGIDKLTIKT